MITAEAALDNAVLEAARAVVSATPDHYARQTWANASARNRPQLVLLDQLIGAVEPVAAAIEDNAWDERQPIPADQAKRLAESLNSMADAITRAAMAPS